ncbi:MAG: hypothetical protein C4289_11135 [Chloroflexota bacterium]
MQSHHAKCTQLHRRRQGARSATLTGRRASARMPGGSVEVQETHGMRYGTIPAVSERVSRLVMGSLLFSLETPEQRDTTFALLDRFVEAGGNVVDTAYIYRRGESERALGAWLQARSSRDRMIIITKGGFVYHSDGCDRRAPDGQFGTSPAGDDRSVHPAP